MTSIGRYWRTVRHLKIRQVVGRVVFRLGAPVPRNRKAPGVRGRSGRWVLPARRDQSLFEGRRFRFLNEECVLGEGVWDPEGISRLWRYNLHYFDDLNAYGASARETLHREFVSRWVSENPPARGTGWEPYPTSLRIVNWVKWFLGGSAPESAWLDSMAHQVRWLRRRMEWHLLGNHLFANSKALFAAGMYFEGEEADDWRSCAISIISRELREQILDDGGQFERSPMYHMLALEDVLDLLCLVAIYGEIDESVRMLRGQLEQVAGRMLTWARAMRFEDGSLPRLNDTADGISPSPAEMDRVALELGLVPAYPVSEPMHVLFPSGYVRMAWDRALIFLDIAPVGPDYIPGHGHADTLSFELSVGGTLLVVNRGTSCYGESQRRGYERGTAAHSTVQVCNENSSEVWGGFRVGRRARVSRPDIDGDAIACEHDGYSHLPGKPVHRRSWRRLHRGLEVRDRISAGAQAVARFHLAPGVEVELVGGNRWRIGPQGVSGMFVDVHGGEVRVVETLHALAFGILQPAKTLEVDLVDGGVVTKWQW